MRGKVLQALHIDTAAIKHAAGCAYQAGGRNHQRIMSNLIHVKDQLRPKRQASLGLPLTHLCLLNGPDSTAPTQ